MSTTEETLKEIATMTGLARMNALIVFLQKEGMFNTNFVEYRRVVFDIFADSSVASKEKLHFGEKLNQWGDPRLSTSNEDAYWVNADALEIEVGQFLVTIKEWKEFLVNGYKNKDNWSEEGWAWKEEDHPSWNELVSEESDKKYVFDNQPAVGVSWYEAEAFATSQNARLMKFYEHENLIRGEEKKPYPWGAPFGHGNANTIEEKLDKPTAVGLYERDSVLGKVFDLAGNVGEWMSDMVDDRRVIHPGAWDVDSLGSWAKASSLVSPTARTGNIGFRLVRDIE